VVRVRKRERLLALSVVVAAAFFLVGGGASAATRPISGWFANGGCSVPQLVAVSAPSRIEVSISTTSASQTDLILIVNSSGKTVSDTGAYDAPRAGRYGLTVCSQGDPLDPAVMQYTGLLATGPSGQPALSPGAAAVAFK
jgi:hypothetical protein